MSMKGLDISAHVGDVNFVQLKADGYEFVMLRAGGSDDGFYTDIMFYENVRKAKSAGLYVGAYYFVGENCMSENDGVADADRFIDIVSGIDFDFPLAMDCEVTPYTERKRATDAAIAFCKTVEDAGYYAMIYAADWDGFANRLELDRLSEFDLWVANWSSFPSYVPEERVGIWQNATLANGYDSDIAFRDYPTIIHNMNADEKHTEWELIKKYGDTLFYGKNDG